MIGRFVFGCSTLLNSIQNYVIFQTFPVIRKICVGMTIPCALFGLKVAYEFCTKPSSSTPFTTVALFSWKRNKRTTNTVITSSLCRWFMSVCFVPFHVRWVPCHHSMAHPQVADGGHTLQVWWVAANILNKQSRTADKGWPSSLGVGLGANNSSP
jgi:hypothetical protein